MSFDVHTLDLLAGSSALSNLDRLKVGMLTNQAVPGGNGDLTGAVVESAGVGYTSIPTVTAAGGSGATITADMQVATTTITAAGGSVAASYAIGDTITATGGTAGTAAVFEVTAATLVAANILAAGGAASHSYAPGDTVVPAGGTFTGSPVITVTHTQAVSATVVSGGTGGTPGAVTLTGTTGTGTKFQATGTINGSGVLTGALVISVAGNYTVNPTVLTIEPCTNNASATGITVSVVMGALTATATGGIYTVEPGSGTLTQTSTSGAGTGATFTGGWGVSAMVIQNAGSYSVLPGSGHLTQGSSSGSGTGWTATVNTWGVQSVSASGGVGYANGAALAFTTAGSTTSATGYAVTQPIGESVIIPITAFHGLPPSYNVQVCPNGPCSVSVSGKTSYTFNVVLTPTSSSVPVGASAFDLMLFC